MRVDIRLWVSWTNLNFMTRKLESFRKDLRPLLDSASCFGLYDTYESACFFSTLEGSSDPPIRLLP